MYRTLTHGMLCMLLILAGIYTSKAQCPAATPLVINAVTVTESRCAASGAATVSVSGGTAPYTFSITAGPALSPPQSSNILQSLAPGNYTVQVTDQCNTSVTRNFTVTGSYTPPVPTITTQSPSCPGSSDGSLTITVPNGRTPLSYSLISPSPVTAGPQAGNVFTGLPAGTYTCQVTDSCGNFQTRTATVSGGSAGAVSIGADLQRLACDSFAYVIFINTPVGSSDYRPPYTNSVTLPNGTVISHVLTAPAAGFSIITDTIRFSHHHITGDNETVKATVTNNCGASQGYQYPLAQLDMQVNATTPGGCGSSFTYTFDYGMDNNGSPSRVHCGTITYTLVSPSGAILATQTNNSTFTGYPPGQGYKVIRQDCCTKDSLTFDWAAPPRFTISNCAPYLASCKEGITSLIVFLDVSITRCIVVAAGPPSVTFADGTVHTYTYPDTIQNRHLSAGGIYINGLTAGTWKLYAVDVCGNKDSITTTITPSQLRHSSFTATPVKGCGGVNSIMLNAVSNASFNTTTLSDASITINSAKFTDVTTSPFTGSAGNLSSGISYVAYNYANPLASASLYPNGMNAIGCDVITDTVNIPAYTQPLFNSSAAVALCGATRQVALLPDSTSGVAPYTFRIIAGPTTTPMQASPAFTGLTRGTYTFLMADACANSYSRSITIDTLALPNVVTTGSTCIGNAATLSLPASPFFSYSWQRPNGSTSTGNTLTLNPVTASDIGTYNMSVTSTVGGCTSTTSKSLTLNPCQALAETLLRFSGQPKNGSIQLNWQTADEINMSYYIVERSTDGIVFTPVQQVAVTGKTLNTYSAADMHVPAGVVYYRLQMVENSGAITYSSIISFNNINTQPFTVYPSLIRGNTPVTVTGPVTSHTASIRVIGVDGKVWRTIPVAAGAAKTSIDVTSLAKGSYFVVFTANDNVITTQIWKE